MDWWGVAWKVVGVCAHLLLGQVLRVSLGLGQGLAHLQRGVEEQLVVQGLRFVH